MPDNKGNSPQPTKAQLAAYVRANNATAKNLSDDEIVDKLVSKQPKIGKMVSDYSNPSLQGPIPAKNKFPMISDINKSVGQMGQAMPEKSLIEEFQDLETERARASVAKESYNAIGRMGGFNKTALENQQKDRETAIKYEQKANAQFEKFKVKYNEDPQIQSLKNNALSKLQNFVAEDNLGGTYVDNAKVRSYIRKTFPQAANTQFEDYVVQNISSDILFKTKEPKIKEKVLKLAKEKNINVPENFLDLNSEVAKNAQKISDKVSSDISKVNSKAELDITNLNQGYKNLTESISKKYSDKDFIAQNFQSEEDYNNAYRSEMSNAFDEYSREFSRVKSNYMLLSQRLQGDYKRSMSELQVNTEKQKAEIGKLLQQSLMDLNEEENETKLKNLKFVSGLFDSQSPLPISSKFILSLNSGLAGNWLNMIATNIKMGSNSQIATDFQDFTSNLTKKLSTPKSEINSIKELVDPTKFAISSGQMIGQMLPAIGAGIGVAAATGGTGIVPALAAGTIGWFDEASQARASNYQSMIEQGLDPEEAKNRANNTYAGYLASYPLALVESAALFGKFGKGSMLRRIVTNIAADIPSETLQEISQNEADESIVMNRPMDFGKMFDLGNVYKTALNVAPASIVMPIPGSAIESVRENEPVSQVANWALRISTAPIHSMAQNVLKNGLYANMAVLETMRHNGVITEEGMNQMKAKVQEVSSDMESAKAAGLNKKQQSVYAGLMGNVRSMEESASQLANQEMDEESRTKATEIANKRIENARSVASDYLNTKNGNFAEIKDNQGDRYIVSHEQLTEMLEDESFQQDVRDGNARVELNYNKKAGENLGNLSKKLLSLNKNYNEGLREYGQSEKNLNALRKKLGLPEEPTSSTTIDGLIGQTVTYSVDRFPSRIRITGQLGVQNGQLVIVNKDNGGVLRLGRAKEFVGVQPSFLDITFEPQKYEGPKMTSQEAKLPSLLSMFAGKVEPKTLIDLLSNVISDVKKSQITKMVKAFDSAYQRKMQQKSINESLPKPNKLVEVEEPEVGNEYAGDEVASSVAQVGDKTSNTLLGKIMSFVQRDFIATTIDLDDLHENNEEFRNRVEQERGEKVDRFKTDYSNTENVPAVLVNGKVEDGMGRLARLYLNGQKTATVFENIKTKEDATTKSKRKVQAAGTESNISEYQGTEAEQDQEAAETDTSNSNILGKKVTVKPAIAQITSENVNDVYGIKGNSVQKKVLNDIKKVVTALKSIVKLTVNIHNQESFTEAVLEAGATKEDALSRGFYMSADGSIHLNLDMVKSDTMLHEGFHPLLDYIALNKPNFIKDIYKELESIPEAKPIIDFAKRAYSGTTTQMKEAITDFVAGVADGRVVINPNNLQKIKSFVLNILRKLGIGEGMILINIETKPQLIKLANFVTEKFRRGDIVSYTDLEDILVDETVDPINVSNIAVVDPQQFSRAEENKSIFSPFKVSWIPKGLKINKPAKTSRVYDILVKSGGAVVIINSDATGIGLKNGVLRQGGIGYTFIEQNVSDKIGFAASMDSKQSAFYKAVQEAARVRDEKFPEMAGKPVSVFVMVQVPEAMFGNAYGADFFIDAISNSLDNNEISSDEARKEITSFFESFKTSNATGRKYENSIDKLIGLINDGDLKTKEGRNLIYNLLISNRENSDDKSAKFGFDARRVMFSQFFNRIGKANNKPGGKLRDLLDIDGYNHKSFFDKYADENVMGSLSGRTESDRLADGGFAMTGFFVDPTMTEEQYKTASRAGTYQHKQFNGRFHGVDPFVLNGKLYVNNAFPEARFVDENGREVPVQVSAAGSLYPRTRQNPQDIIERSIAWQKVAETNIINGFYSPIENRINSFKQPKASVNKWKEIIGIKSDEAVFSGMADYLNELKPEQQLLKEDVLKFIKDNRIKINTVSRGGDYIVYNPKTGDDIAYFNNSYDAYAFQSEAAYEGDNYEVNEPSQYLKTRYEEYQLPGGNNYQEVLITLPGKDQFKSSHFDETNIITHLRMNTRTDSSGKKVLFLEEVQSDWGQIGRDKGFTRKINDSEIKKINEINSRQNTILNSLKSYRLLDSFIGDILRSNYKPEVGKLKIDPVYDLLDAIEGYISGRIDNPYYDANNPEEVKRNRDIIVDGIKKQIIYSNKFEDNKYSLSDKQINDIIDAYNEDSKNGRIKKQKGYDTDRMVLKAFDEVDNLRIEAFNIFKDATKQLTAPAPYVTNTNAWVKLGLKVAIKEAINQGADKIAWITGEQQSERYDLRNQLDEIFYFKKSNDTYNITAYKDNRILFQEDSITPNTLADYFGKDIANRIVNGQGVKPKKTAQGFTFNRGTKLEGDDLAFEGKGMKAFYGNANNPGIVANVAKALVKELTGGKGDIITSKIEIDGKLNEQPAIDITTDLKQSVKGGMPQFQKINWEKSKDGKGDPSISSRNPIVVDAAKKLKEGKITNEEYRATVSQNSPISPITKFFEPATEQQINNALSKDKIEKINAPISDGDTVGLRLDIPAYSNNNTWVVSVHDGDTNAGKAISYRNVARITDVRFGVEPKAALSIAAGIPKTTIGRMFGKWSNVEGSTMNEQGINAKELIQSIVDDPNYVQVGMNPFRHSYFYDRSSDIGRPIVSADEVIQIGGLVYAKNPVYGKWTDEAYRVKGLFDASGIPVQFQKAAPTKSKLQTIKDNPLFANLSDSQAERLAKGITIWQQWATSYGLLGKEAKVAEEYKIGYVSQELYKADKAVKNVVKQLEIAKKAGLNISDNDITEYITGNSVPKNLPQDLKLALGVMRNHIDLMTEELILNGAITDPQEIQEFRNNKGKYLGRFYDMFISGKNLTLNNIVEKLKDVDKNVIDRAYTLIRTEIYKGIKRANPNLSQAELDKVVDNSVNDILNSIVEYTSNPYVKKPIKGSVNMKALMARQDIVEPIRALMGEVKNPVSRYYATIAKMASVAGGMRYLNTIRDIGMGNFLFEENDPNRPSGTVKISSESNKNLAPISGLYTFREIRDGFNDYMMATGKPDSIGRSIADLVDKAMGTAKYMNTVGNLPTHIKNFTSNIGILVNNGYIADIPNAIEFIINEPEAFKKAYEELRKSGTLNNNINATELKSYFEKNNDIDKILSNKFKKQNVVKRGRDVLTALYNVEDDVFKVLAYIVESQRYAKAYYKTSFTNLSNNDKDSVTKKSIEIVKSILPLFSRVPPFIKGMNKYAYLGTFMTFTAESIRVSKNTLLIAIKELSDEKTRSIGAKRLIGIATWNSAYGYATVSSAAGVGAMATGAFTYWYNAIQQIMSDDDEEYAKKVKKERSIRRIVRDFNIPSDIYTSKASEGKLVYYDIGSINPYQFMTNFLNRFDQLAKDERDGYAVDLAKAVAESLSPFVKTDFIADRFITAYRAIFGRSDGKIPVDSYGKNIYNQNDNAYEKYAKIGAYLGQAFIPGMAKNAYKAYNLFNTEDAEAAKAEIVSTLTVRKTIVDANKWFYSKLAKGTQPLLNGINEQAKEYSAIAYKDVSNEEKEKQYQESLNKTKKGIYEISENFKAALDVGVNQDDLVRSMMMAKMKQENIAAVIESLTMDIDKIDPELILMRKH